MNRERIAALIRDFPAKRILVVGDLMLDEFLWGKVSRISPEAPVPVVEVVKEEWFPGGAANVARNLAEFSKNVRIMGVTGQCSHAEHLKNLLTSEGIDVSAVQSHSCYQTIVKTRIIARQQHVVRIDREKKLEVRPEHAAAALAQLEALLPRIDAIGKLDLEVEMGANQDFGAVDRIDRLSSCGRTRQQDGDNGCGEWLDHDRCPRSLVAQRTARFDAACALRRAA